MKYDQPVEAIELKKSNGDGKVWVQVRFNGGVLWLPRLWEVGAIISGIGRAEDIKYPYGQGHRFTREFFDECWGKTRDEIYNLSLSEKFDPNGVMRSRYNQTNTLKQVVDEYNDGSNKMNWEPSFPI